EARQAFATKVLMSDPSVRDYLMGIFKDSAPDGKFDMVSLGLMRINYAAIEGQVDQTNNENPILNGQPNPAWLARQRQIEIELAMRTARMHNGDYNHSANNG